MGPDGEQDSAAKQHDHNLSRHGLFQRFRNRLHRSRSRSKQGQGESSTANPQSSHDDAQTVPGPSTIGVESSHGLSHSTPRLDTPRDQKQTYWARAFKSLKQRNPKAYEHFSRVKDELGNADEFNRLPLANLENIIKKSDREASQKRSWAGKLYQRCARSILQYKELMSSLAALDPHKIAPSVFNGVCVLLQASINCR